ncbi:uncharacterized mitochondrial protein-like protein [Tanacetum coccineum]
MIEPERPLKRKEQVVADEEYAKQLAAKMEAELEKEEKERRHKEEEANLALIELWESKKAMMEADRLLAERLQAREREELTIEEKSKLFVELMNKRRKHFADLRDQEKRNKPPTKPQKRSQMSTYLKNIGTWKHSQLKSKTYEEIERLFKLEMKRRAGEELEYDVSKKQKVVEQIETEGVDDLKEEEMKRHMEVVREDNTVIDAVPLASKPPIIIDYKIIKAGIIGHFQLIREDGSSKRHGDTGPEDEYERVLWGDLKVMYEPDMMSDVWRSLQGYKVLIWKLFDSCGVHYKKAVVVGNVVFTDDRDEIDCCKMSIRGKGIPPNIERVGGMRKYPCIIMSARGQLDVSRHFLRKMKMDLRLPIFSLIDSDPYGLRILSAYSFGSESMSYNSANLCIPDIFWLGLRPYDWETYQIPEKSLLPMTPDAMKVARNLLKEDL